MALRRLKPWQLAVELTRRCRAGGALQWLRIIHSSSDMEWMSFKQLNLLLLLPGWRKLECLQQTLVPCEEGNAAAMWGCQIPQRPQGWPLYSQEPALSLLIPTCMSRGTSLPAIMSYGPSANDCQAVIVNDSCRFHLPVN